MKLQVDLTAQQFRDPVPGARAALQAAEQSPRLCKSYCNALVLQGHVLARCPHCALCERFVQLFGRPLT